MDLSQSLHATEPAIPEARAIYGGIFPVVPSANSETRHWQVIRSAAAMPIAVMGLSRDQDHLSSPVNCHEQTVTTLDFAYISMLSCLMGAPQLADWMKQHPAERLAEWRCVIGNRDGRGA